MAVVEPHPVECEGKLFSSIKEFANHYGLNYSKVQHYRRRGKTPEEIVEACRFTAVSKRKEPADDPHRMPCEYDGVQYESIYEAATALGIAPTQVYDLRKRHKVTPSEAIKMAVDRKLSTGQRPPYAAKPCVVDGVEYESREAAIKAYHIPRVSVYSRMQREDISFEEALVRGRRESIYCPPTASLFTSLRLIPSNTELQKSVLEDIATSLRYYTVSVQYLRDLITYLPVLYADDSIYLFFNHDAKGIEIVSVLPFSMDAEKIDLLNGAYACVKLAHEPLSGRLLLTGFQMAKEEGQDIKPLLNAYFSFSAIKEQLIRRFGAVAADAPDASEAKEV